MSDAGKRDYLKEGKKNESEIFEIMKTRWQKMPRNFIKDINHKVQKQIETKQEERLK